jgi:choline transport protein
MIVALATYWHPDYVPETWHIFLIFQAINFVFTAYNIFLMKRTSWIHDFGC